MTSPDIENALKALKKDRDDIAQRRIEELEQALAFYADRENYIDGRVLTIQDVEGLTLTSYDNGATARNALGVK